MIYFIFDLDDTIVIHPTVNRDMYNIKSDPCLQSLFDNLYYQSYIFTNRTIDDAHLILDKFYIDQAFIQFDQQFHQFYF